MGVVLVGGVHGVGKTTTIEAARALTKSYVPVLKGSDILARLLGVSTEQIPEVDPGRRALARVAMYQELAMAKNGVRDCHFCTYSSTGYEFPLETGGDIGEAAVAVVIEASPETVLKRRLEITRERPKDIDVIREQQLLEREAAMRAATKLGIDVVLLENETGSSAAHELSRLFTMHINEGDEHV